RVEIRQFEGIAIKPGEFLDQLGVDRQRNIGLVERNSNRRFRYRDRVIHLADLERNVDRDVSLRLYRKVLLDSLAESGQLCRKRVGSRIDIIKPVESRLVGHLDRLNSSFDVVQSKGGSWNHGSALIGHQALNFPSELLPPGCREYKRAT